MSLMSIYIPANYYVSISEAARWLEKSPSTLQYHINKNNIETIHFPGLGHLIKEDDIRNFIPKSPGRPSIYKK